MKKLIIFSVILLSYTICASAQVAVIANKSVSITALEAAKIAEIYALSTQKWSDGSKIVVFDLKTDDAVKEKFYKFINKNPADLRKEWLRLQLTGEGKAPAAVKTDDELLQQVASTAGAIGYVSTAKVTDAVKVVAKID